MKYKAEDFELAEELTMPKRFWVMGDDNYYPSRALQSKRFESNDLQEALNAYEKEEKAEDSYDNVELIDMLGGERVLLANRK